MERWLEGEGVGQRPPDVIQVSKGHGRLEQRALWWSECRALGVYLEQQVGWPGMRWCGWLRRRRGKPRGLPGEVEWQEEKTVLWVAGGEVQALPPEVVLEELRAHWEIENRGFWVRDVTLAEDRQTARQTALALSTLRNVAIGLIRRLGYRFVPDGFRALSARPDRGLALLIEPIVS